MMTDKEREWWRLERQYQRAKRKAERGIEKAERQIQKNKKWLADMQAAYDAQKVLEEGHDQEDEP